MRLTFVAAAAVACLPTTQAAAQVLAVQVRNGDVYVQQAAGWGRLTRDSHATEAAKSRDGSLIAYVHTEGTKDGEAMNSISVCVVAEKSFKVIVSPSYVEDVEQNLTGANSPAFSYQASAGKDGAPVGSLFFLTTAWATSGAVHRATLGPNPTVSYVTPGNSLVIVPSGKFAGALDITQHIYAKEAGSCDQERIFDPNTKQILQKIQNSDCEAQHIQ